MIFGSVSRWKSLTFKTNCFLPERKRLSRTGDTSLEICDFTGLAKNARTVDLKSFGSERNHANSDVIMLSQNGTCMWPHFLSTHQGWYHFETLLRHRSSALRCNTRITAPQRCGCQLWWFGAGTDVTGFVRGQSGSFHAIQLGRTISPVLGDLFRSGKKQFLLNLKDFHLVRDPKNTEPFL